MKIIDKSINSLTKSCGKLLQLIPVINTPSFRKGLGRPAALAVFCFALIAFLSACSENDNTPEEYPDWRNTNVTYWNNLYNTTRQKIASGDTSWQIIKNYSLEDSLNTGVNTDYIIVNILQNGTGAGCPLYTDSVRIRYTGRLLPSTSYPDGYVFDTTNPGNVPDEQAGTVDMSVSRQTSGFQTALQHMHIGDHWEIYIPWTLAYGTTQSSTSSIPPYSVLRFTVSLVAYCHAGAKLPDFKAKKGNMEWITE